MRNILGAAALIALGAVSFSASASASPAASMAGIGEQTPTSVEQVRWGGGHGGGHNWHGGGGWHGGGHGGWHGGGRGWYGRHHHWRGGYGGYYGGGYDYGDYCYYHRYLRRCRWY